MSLRKDLPRSERPSAQVRAADGLEVRYLIE
uniref:Uncharacterized protein n=1 Tax=Dulem virus 38 TaxID=3145756 RepID=A0AAU8B2C1_9CAUD